MNLKEENAIIDQAKTILYARLHKGDVLANTAKTIRDYLSLYLADAQRECFGVICLNNTGYVIGNQVLFKGTMSEVKVYHREILKLALAKNAHSVVIYHNHPQGECKASRADKGLTDKLKEALSHIDVKLVDHIIIAGDKTFSFHEEGLL